MTFSFLRLKKIDVTMLHQGYQLAFSPSFVQKYITYTWAHPYIIHNI